MVLSLKCAEMAKVSELIFWKGKMLKKDILQFQKGLSCFYLGTYIFWTKKFPNGIWSLPFKYICDFNQKLYRRYQIYFNLVKNDVTIYNQFLNQNLFKCLRFYDIIIIGFEQIVRVFKIHYLNRIRNSWSIFDCAKDIKVQVDYPIESRWIWP